MPGTFVTRWAISPPVHDSQGDRFLLPGQQMHDGRFQRVVIGGKNEMAEQPADNSFGLTDNGCGLFAARHQTHIHFPMRAQ